MRILIFVLFALALATPAYADLMLQYQDEEGAHLFTMYVKGQRMRLETHEDASAMLYDAAKSEITILELSDRQYTVLDRATAQRMRQQMEQAFEMMRRQGIDPSTMGMGDMQVRVRTRSVSTGQSRTVDGRRCEVMRYEVNDEVTTLACVVKPDALGISETEWATITGMFDSLSEFVSGMMPQSATSIDFMPTEGLPVEASEPDGSDLQRLSKIEHAPLQDALFSVPRGFRRVSIDR